MQTPISRCVFIIVEKSKHSTREVQTFNQMATMRWKKFLGLWGAKEITTINHIRKTKLIMPRKLNYRQKMIVTNLLR